MLDDSSMVPFMTAFPTHASQPALCALRMVAEVVNIAHEAAVAEVERREDIAKRTHRREAAALSPAAALEVRCNRRSPNAQRLY